MKKTSLLKLVGALLIAAGAFLDNERGAQKQDPWLAAGAFFTPSTLVAKGGSLACRPDGVTCRPSDFIPCCGVCSKGICRPILE